MESVLWNLKLKFDAKLINQIMSEERGSALWLLFIIKANQESWLKLLGQTNISTRLIDKKYHESK